jgi:hypothetical protein
VAREFELTVDATRMGDLRAVLPFARLCGAFFPRCHGLHRPGVAQAAIAPELL